MYVVFVTAILQDSILSVKIASNMLEREVRADIELGPFAGAHRRILSICKI